MRHQLGEGEERKKPLINAAKAGNTGFKKGDELTDPVVDEEIDPAEYFDPEEFGIRRRFSHDR